MNVSPVFRDHKLLGFTIDLRGEEDLTNFQQLLQKGLNCWPESPKALKDLADFMMYGKSLQDYTLYERDPGKTPSVTG